MKKRFYHVLFLCGVLMGILCSCSDKKPETSALVEDETPKDSTEEVEDSIPIIPQAPKAADKLFADFFFDFTTKKKIQMNRIKFPLEIVENGKTTLVQRGAWKMERFYQNQEYYTQIFDSEKQRESVSKKDVDTVVVEKIQLKKGIVEQYVFNHPDGFWILANINRVGLKDCKNASFLTFLQTFFADKKYQMAHVATPLKYVGPDPDGDDESTVVKRNIPASSWSEYVPEIPRDQIYNILYGQVYSEGNEKVFLFKGISNGLETELQFKKSGGNWKLVKIRL